MRYKKKHPPQFRKLTRFLFFPLTIGNETRWLEKTTWVEFYDRFESGFGNVYERYDPVFWYDKPEEGYRDSQYFDFWLPDQKGD